MKIPRRLDQQDDDGDWMESSSSSSWNDDSLEDGGCHPLPVRYQPCCFLVIGDHHHHLDDDDVVPVVGTVENGTVESYDDRRSDGTSATWRNRTCVRRIHRMPSCCC